MKRRTKTFFYRWCDDRFMSRRNITYAVAWMLNSKREYRNTTPVIATARKRPLSLCLKRRWRLQVTAKHTSLTRRRRDGLIMFTRHSVEANQGTLVPSRLSSLCCLLSDPWLNRMESVRATWAHMNDHQIDTRTHALTRTHARARAHTHTEKRRRSSGGE